MLLKYYWIFNLRKLPIGQLQISFILDFYTLKSKLNTNCKKVIKVPIGTNHLKKFKNIGVPQNTHFKIFTYTT